MLTEYRLHLIEHYPEHGAFSGAVRNLLRDLEETEFLRRFTNVRSSFSQSGLAMFMFRQTLTRAGRTELLREVMEE
jgi:hypothetical protein